LEDADKVIAEQAFEMPWLPKGQLTGVVAPPGTGKSLFVLYGIVRPIVVGGLQWFDGSPGPSEPGKVLWLATEFDLAILIKRCKVLGLPLRQILLLGVNDVSYAPNLELEADRKRILEIAKKHNVRIIVLDSLRGSFSGDENSSAVMASVLGDLAQIAQALNIVFIVIHHCGHAARGESPRSRGSSAIRGLFRNEIMIHKPDPNNPVCKLWVEKTNFVKPDPIGFRITDDGLEFEAAPEKPVKRTEIDDAVDWLKERMAPGQAYKASDLIAEAQELGHSKMTIQRAATTRLGIKPEQVREGGKIRGWSWTRL
jgi:hypothetical protein